jgi:hypothetical protein
VQLFLRITLRKPPAFLSRHIFFLNLFSAIAFSQGIPLSTDSSGQRDSSLSIQDSVLVDTLAAPDLPGKLARAFSRESGTATSISRTDLQWFGHRYAGEIIGQVPGAYLRDPGVEGQYSQINFRGSDWRSVAVLADGRLLNDPATGTYNLYYYATDYLDHVEIVSGPRSFLYGMNAAGGSIHFVSRNLDTNRPLSRINYTEGPHGYGSVDGTIAQNVAERTNVTLGFQRQVADGRYDNSAHEAWNLRAKVRHAFTDRLFLVLSEYYTGTKTQLNGGIAPDAASLENAFFPLETSSAIHPVRPDFHSFILTISANIGMRPAEKFPTICLSNQTIAPHGWDPVSPRTLQDRSTVSISTLLSR